MQAAESSVGKSQEIPAQTHAENVEVSVAKEEIIPEQSPAAESSIGKSEEIIPE
jgi:hypothetical protein